MKLNYSYFTSSVSGLLHVVVLETWGRVYPTILNPVEVHFTSFCCSSSLSNFILITLSRSSESYIMSGESLAAISIANLQRFTVFMNLPLELRYIVWQYVLSPRIVEILASSD